MPAPNPPSDFRAVVPKSTEMTIVIFAKFFWMMFLYWKWKKYAFGEDGLPTDTFVGDICERVCEYKDKTATYNGCLCLKDGSDIF